MNGANERDTEARKADIDGLCGLLMLRQAVLTGMTKGHAHEEAIREARDSVVREIKWRFTAAQFQIRELERQIDRSYKEGVSEGRSPAG